MDFLFTEEQRMLKESARDFFAKEFSPEISRQHEAFGDELTRKIHRKMGELGWLGILIEERYEGGGGNSIDYGIIVEEVGKVLMETPMLMTCGNIAVCIQTYAGEDLKKRYLPKISSGEEVWALGMTEPNAGSDAANTQTTAILDGDDFIINGSKMFSSTSDQADFFLAIARTAKTEPKHKGLTLFIVDRRSSGVTARPLNALGGHGVTAEVFYDNVRVPKSNMVGEIHKGWYQLMATMDRERSGASLWMVGIAQGAFDLALQYAKERVQFGQPIGKFQAIQHYFADMATEIEMARLLGYKVAWMESRHIPCNKEAAMAKLVAGEVAKSTAIKCMQIMGGYGYMMEYDIQRYLRKAMVLTIVAGTSEIQKNIIAKNLGL